MLLDHKLAVALQLKAFQNIGELFGESKKYSAESLILNGFNQKVRFPAAPQKTTKSG